MIPFLCDLCRLSAPFGPSLLLSCSLIFYPSHYFFHSSKHMLVPIKCLWVIIPALGNQMACSPFVDPMITFQRRQHRKSCPRVVPRKTVVQNISAVLPSPMVTFHILGRLISTADRRIRVIGGTVLNAKSCCTLD